jgi:hypothetical protein
MSFIGRWLDKLKVTALVKFLAPYIKTLAPYVVTGLVAIGVDPELAQQFSENLSAVVVVGITFGLDLLLTAIRKKA